MNKIILLPLLLILVGFSFGIETYNVFNTSFTYPTTGGFVTGGLNASDTNFTTSAWVNRSNPGTDFIWFDYTYNYSFISNDTMLNFTYRAKAEDLAGGVSVVPNIQLWNYTSGAYQTLWTPTDTGAPWDYIWNFTTQAEVNDFVNDTKIFTRVEVKIEGTGATATVYDQNLTITFDPSYPTWNQTPEDQTAYDTSWFYQVNASDNNVSLIYWLDDTDYIQIDSVNGTITSNSTENIQTEVIIFANNTYGYQVNQTVEFTIVRNSIYNCSGENQTIVFFFKNETVATPLTGNLELSVEVTSPIYFNTSTSVTDVWNTSLCLFPRTDTYLADIIAEYSKTDYTTRWHYYDNYNLSNTTKNIDLILLPTGDATDTTFTVYDNFGNTDQGTIIEAWKFELGNYTLVAMGKSNVDGEDKIQLEQNKEYEYILKEEGIISRTIAKSKLIGTTVTLTTIATISDFLTYDWGTNFDTSCSYNNVTKVMSCSVKDKGKATTSLRWQVYVQRNATSGWTAVCDQEVATTGATQSFTCDLSGYVEDPNSLGSSVYYGVAGKYEGVEFMVVGEYADSTYFYESRGYGGAGAFSAGLLIMALALAGVSLGPIVALSFTGVGLFVSTYLQLIDLTPQTLGYIIVMLAVIIYISRRK